MILPTGESLKLHRQGLSCTHSKNLFLLGIQGVVVQGEISWARWITLTGSEHSRAGQDQLL